LFKTIFFGVGGIVRVYAARCSRSFSVQKLGLITAKPMLFVANVDDAQASDLAAGKEVCVPRTDACLFPFCFPPLS
jgi:ribosome-binding ATPase YchF (GTP1/OBG family)